MDKDTLFYKKHTINCGSRLISIETPIVMGILNLTPDSFYDGGQINSTKDVNNKVKKLIDEGAAIIDVGAYSTKPGAEDVSVHEEKIRLEPGLNLIRERYPDTIISVDTFRAETAKWCIEKYKIDIINDISGGHLDSEIIDVAAGFQVPYITMHMQGTPKTMQKNPGYKHVVKDVLDYFSEHIAFLRQKGINDIIIDPGFGFGKTIEHNYQLLAGLDVFQMLELPILAGISRKSMIYRHLNSSPEEALAGTIALNTIALQKGAQILRVHDVKEAVNTISIYKKLLEESEKSINLLQKL
ncbi:MAG: dihydropteroate synthase [Bacteroidales bacterium]|nr:dihydropteroate synthase [Bacteroidales bacterium]MBN2818311.1 dihydropteroate synthase [Bacteroidales bacterium]